MFRMPDGIVSNTYEHIGGHPVAIFVGLTLHNKSTSVPIAVFLIASVWFISPIILQCERFVSFRTTKKLITLIFSDIPLLSGLGPRKALHVSVRFGRQHGRLSNASRTRSAADIPSDPLPPFPRKFGS